jgi:hypothetical protein
MHSSLRKKVGPEHSNRVKPCASTASKKNDTVLTLQADDFPTWHSVTTIPNNAQQAALADPITISCFGSTRWRRNQSVGVFVQYLGAHKETKFGVQNFYTMTLRIPSRHHHECN